MTNGSDASSAGRSQGFRAGKGWAVLHSQWPTKLKPNGLCSERSSQAACASEPPEPGEGLLTVRLHAKVYRRKRLRHEYRGLTLTRYAGCLSVYVRDEPTGGCPQQAAFPQLQCVAALRQGTTL